MRKIYVLDEDNKLKEIDAGITEYSELKDAPIHTTYNGVKLIGSRVDVVDEQLVITADEEYKWTCDDQEGNPLSDVLKFCEYAESGRYDIITDQFGIEILIVDRTSNAEGMQKRYRRITAEQDFVYDLQAKQ
jgi:hypothetical protein